MGGACRSLACFLNSPQGCVLAETLPCQTPSCAAHKLCALHAGLFVQRTMQVAELAAGFVFCRHTYLLRVPVLIGDYTGGLFQGHRNAELCCL